jgi:CO/xanthine dehydrogenase FAD-binding subunit
MKTVKKFARVNAKKIDEALSAPGAANVWAISGGIDLVGSIRFKMLAGNLCPQILVNLRTITPGLNYIKEEKGILKIGALT